MTVHIAWIDTVAVRRVIEGYQFWEISIGLAVRVQKEMQGRGYFAEPWIEAGYWVAEAIYQEPERCVQVLRSDGLPLKPAIDYGDRFYPFMAPHEIKDMNTAAGRVIHEENWITYIRPATVAVASEPSPGLYRMRLKPERWSSERRQIDDRYQNFLITEVRGDSGTTGQRRPPDQLPWHNLPEPELD